jgi:hypothetical protein
VNQDLLTNEEVEIMRNEELKNDLKEPYIPHYLPSFVK